MTVIDRSWISLDSTNHLTRLRGVKSEDWVAKARLAVLAPWPMAFRRKILVAGVDANMIVDDGGEGRWW